MKVLVVSDNDLICGAFETAAAKISMAHFKFARTKISKRSYSGNTAGRESISMNDDAERITLEYDLVISAHSKQIFPTTIVNKVRCVNFHPGLNPHNRGWYPQVFSIINHKPLGVTVHEMDEQVDHGPIIYQEQVPVFAWDTSATAYDRVLGVELKLIEDKLETIVKGEYQTEKPTSEGNINTLKDFNALCQLNLNQMVTMGQALDLLRALSHPPFKNARFVTEEGKKISVSIKMEVDE